MRALERKTLDARFRTFADPAHADTNIVIIDVDNLSLALLRSTLGRFPWRREAWARIIRFAAAGGAGAIAFDFAFPEPDLDHPADDTAFAMATREAGNVVHTLSIQQIAAGDSIVLEEPYPLLKSAARSLGVINFTPDPVD